jgi:hypothetical protein
MDHHPRRLLSGLLIFLGKEILSDLHVFALFLIYRSGLQTGRFALA